MGLENIGSPEVSQPEIFSFNDDVLVKITPTGEEIRNKYYESSLSEGMSQPSLERDEEGYTRMQLHEVAFMFGQSMSLNTNNPPIEMDFKIIHRK